MPLEQTRQTWERFKTAEAQWHDPEPMMHVHSELFTLNDGLVRGRSALREFEENLRRAFPDWKREYLEVVLGEDAIAFRWCARATNLGPLSGHKPTGRPIELHGASFMRVDSNGLIVESHTVGDPRQMWEQLGLPVPAVGNE